jgi:hypothetical protein
MKEEEILKRLAGKLRIHAQTPDYCDKCEYKEPGMVDGGLWCYMFKDMPKPTCTQFRLSPSLLSSSLAQASKQSEEM